MMYFRLTSLILLLKRNVGLDKKFNLIHCPIIIMHLIPVSQINSKLLINKVEQINALLLHFRMPTLCGRIFFLKMCQLFLSTFGSHLIILTVIRNLVKLRPIKFNEFSASEICPEAPSLWVCLGLGFQSLLPIHSKREHLFHLAN